MHIPPGFGTVSPYFFVEDANSFVTFLLRGLGGREVLRHLRDDGRIANAQVQLGTSTVMVSEASSAYPATKASYYLYVADADASVGQALAAGGALEMPVQNMPYQDRQGGVKDQHGNIWWISQRLQSGPY